MRNNHPSVSLMRKRFLTEWPQWRTAVLAGAAVFGTYAVSAQPTPATASATPTPTAKRPAHHHTTMAQVQTPPAPDPPAAESAPPAPEPPHWPVNDTPNKPSVTWDSHGLQIDANNSSLHEILDQVSTNTGAKVEGLGADERVFGEFGPGETRDVISQLLHGSNYNVLMIGDQGAGTPRQIVLSARRSGGNQPTAGRAVQDMQEDDVQDQPEVEEQQPQQPPLINGRPPMPPMPQSAPGAPRTPQQVLQELQQRQQQMQDQQQQQQQQPH